MTDWTLALCAQTDPALFFPEGRGTADATKAKAICKSCDIRAECLEYALKAKITTGDGFETYMDGVWGATTDRERSKMREPKPLQGHGTRACYQRGCRCPECEEGNRRAKREEYRRRAMKAA